MRALTLGEVVEWSKAHAWKACDAVTYPRVRIPPSPPKPETNSREFDSGFLFFRSIFGLSHNASTGVSNMPFDYKKEYKEFYLPKNRPSIVTIPKMNYIAVKGKGDPNDEDGEYKKSIGLLYAIAFTLKMSHRVGHEIDGYFEYVVPPLEGFWQQDGSADIDYAHKENFDFVSVIRLPDFITKDDFDWAIKEATVKKKTDFSKVEFMEYDEGLCVQCMHIGSYDNEPETIELMNDYIRTVGYESDITDIRRHHEIYLSDPRKCDISKLKTVIRHPIRKI